MSEPTLCEKSVPGRRGIRLPELDVPQAKLPEELVREELALPELAQLGLRHVEFG